MGEATLDCSGVLYLDLELFSPDSSVVDTLDWFWLGCWEELSCIGSEWDFLVATVEDLEEADDEVEGLECLEPFLPDLLLTSSSFFLSSCRESEGRNASVLYKLLYCSTYLHDAG